MSRGGADLDAVAVFHGALAPGRRRARLKELAYDADADKKSWAAMLKMFKEVFGS